MSDKQIAQVQAQLPEGTKILRMYKAMEGDIRVITKGKNDQHETRYTVKFIDDYPKIELMP